MAPPPDLTNDAVGEILLRLPPADPACSSSITRRSRTRTLAVWDPVTGVNNLIPEPDGAKSVYSHSGAVICATAGFDADDHRACRGGGPFVVVFVGNTNATARAWVYSSEASAWTTAPASVDIGEHSFVETRKRGAIVGGDQLFFLFNMGTAILRFDLGRHCLSVVGSPLVYGDAAVLVAMEEDGYLGLGG